MICAILGILLAVLFNNYWIAIIVGALLAVIGVVVSLIAHVINKKLNKIITKGGSLIAGTENYLKNQAIQHGKKLTPKRKNNSNKSL
ncbi:6TM ABC transporter family protein [Entomomonas asaccharolytica]|uniref:Uncharacterized protein n=1 Tax=Entomomonas asaccharolytica TaxID=2785331 RepID=A0A974NF27_9GAMM|nr:hypothetical protein [Entomomonas asaccharolytica]QQP85329.1 hypothetical protein JHT90_13240 [Entomomonas asaccharolytica]